MSPKWYPNVPYSPLFPIIFEKEKKKILKQIRNATIEHIGSTSIPNLSGKGYIDLIISVPKEKMKTAKNSLETKLGYEYKKDISIKGERLFFRKVALSEYSKETFYHLHLTHLNSNSFKQAVSFREFLKKNPKYIKRYSKIKKKASKEAQKTKNRKEAKKIYKKIKDPLIKEILYKSLH
ncbi:GrpB family protein [Patescibacteria group bacterium]|nr:GrpB family protein [Patescibacteria group bacterium]